MWRGRPVATLHVGNAAYLLFLGSRTRKSTLVEKTTRARRCSGAPCKSEDDCDDDVLGSPRRWCRPAAQPQSTGYGDSQHPSRPPRERARDDPSPCARAQRPRKRDRGGEAADRRHYGNTPRCWCAIRERVPDRDRDDRSHEETPPASSERDHLQQSGHDADDAAEDRSEDRGRDVPVEKRCTDSRRTRRVKRGPAESEASCCRDRPAERSHERIIECQLVDYRSGCRDSNPGPPEPHSGTLPGCATPRKK